MAFENKETLKVKHEGGVVIDGAPGLWYGFLKCSNPVPGDDIVGYITKGRSCHPSWTVSEPSFTGKLRTTSTRC